MKEQLSLLIYKCEHNDKLVDPVNNFDILLDSFLDQHSYILPNLRKSVRNEPEGYSKVGSSRCRDRVLARVQSGPTFAYAFGKVALFPLPNIQY